MNMYARIFVSLMLAAAFGQALSAQGPFRFRPITSAGVPGVAEIVDAGSDGNTLYYTNSSSESIGVYDISNEFAPVFVMEIPVGGEPTSISVKGNIVVTNVLVDAASEGDAPPAFAPGKLVVFDISVPTAPALLGEVAIGWQPDSVKLTTIDGAMVAVCAIENEPVIVNGANEVTDDDEPGSSNDVSPAGLVQVVTLNLANVPASNVAGVNFSAAAMNAAGLLFPTDPQPEFVDIHGATAAVSLQENNGIALIDISDPLSPVLSNLFCLGTVSNRSADLTEDDAISFTEQYPFGVAETPEDADGNPVAAGTRFPDAIAFTPNGQRIISADEGELNFTGGRGFSVWKLNGQFRGDDGGQLERTAVKLSHYPEGRSENKGIEIEGVATGTFHGKDYAFILSERGSFMAVYELRNNNQRRLVQMLPTGISPEGVVAIESRDLVITADEESGTLSIFKGEFGLALASPDQPRLYSPNIHRPFAALSGLCRGWFNTLHAVPDNALPTKIYSISTGGSYARVRTIRSVKKNGVQMRYDGEGIARDHSIVKPGPSWFPGGWWIASEGDASSHPNLLVQVDFFGKVRREIQLPNAIDPAADATIPGSAQGAAGGQQIRSNGFEGVTLSTDGRYLLTCIQRDFANEFPTGPRFARIARYDLTQLQGAGSNIRVGGDWEFFFLELDSNDASNWAGLSEITTIDDDQYMVIERDKGIGLESELKKIYAFDLSDLTPDSDGIPDASDTVSKVEVADIVNTFFPYEKVEGLALGQGHKLWVGLDNDGGEVESRLTNLGPFSNPLP